VTTDLGPWLGVLDLDTANLQGVTRPASAGYTEARLLIRLHGAPIGQVSLQVQPELTLAARAQAAASAELAGAMESHSRWDQQFDQLAERAEWAAQVACPQRSADKSGTGVSVIVCSRNRPSTLRECLTSLQQVNYDPIEFLVVDNAPSDESTKSVVAEFTSTDPRIRYTCEPRAGLSRARNHGIAAARFDVLAFTDDDVIVDSSWPAALVAGFAADTGAACVTGLVAARSLDTPAERYFDSRYAWGEAFEPRRYDLAEHRGAARLYPFTAGIFGVGANFAVRREFVTRLGGFDAVLGVGSACRGGDDLDIFVRIILAGYRICYTPCALVWHQHRASHAALAEQVYSYGYGLGAYLAKRLRAREMSVGLLLRAVGYSAVIWARMRGASDASNFKARGKRLAVSEARGVLAGALRYFRVARRKREP
jgi:glycosyltransferase involved in cell wall biosynthesis